MLSWLFGRRFRALVSLINLRFDRLERILMPLAADVEALRGSLDTLKEDLDAFEATHGDTGALQQALDEMTAARDALSQQLGDSNAQVQQLTTAINDAQGASDDAAAKIEAMKSAVDAMDAGLKSAPASGGSQPSP